MKLRSAPARLGPLVLLLLPAAAVPVNGTAAADLPRIRTWSGEAPGDQFGLRVALPGDLNGDGFGDIAVAATANDAGGAAAGRVTVYRGGTRPELQPWIAIDGAAGDLLGSALGGAGDFNGDGWNDLALGAPFSDRAATDGGFLAVCYAGPESDGVIDWGVAGPAGSRLGEAVCGLGDQNGDGFDDLAVGLPRLAGGEVWIFFGGAPPDSVPDLILRPGPGGLRFGQALAGDLDLNGDGARDLLVGEPRNSTAGTWAGKVSIYLGGGLLDTIPDLVLHGEGAGDEFGRAVAGVGDVDDDGLEDWLVGAPFANDGSLDVGRAYLFLGGTPPDTLPDWILTGSAEGDRVGDALAGAGDLDEDGFADFLVGAPGSDAGGADAGQVTLVRGASVPAGFVPDGLDGLTGDRFGSGVAGARFPGQRAGGDFLIGAWAADGAGEATLFGWNWPTGIGESGDHPSPGLRIAAVPNPTRGGAVIRFALDRPETVRMDVFDMRGRRVTTIGGGHALPAGQHRLAWSGYLQEGRPAPAGVYVVRLTAGTRRESVPVVVLP